MKNQYADARPTKSFFIDMLTRDIALEDAVLDLIDNAIDALTRTHGLDLSERLIFAPTSEVTDLAHINVKVTDSEIRVDDDCGGIPRGEVAGNVFRIGRTIPTSQSSIGVYGIGLKRAIFKIGNAFELTSKTRDSGFAVSVSNIDHWAEDDSPTWHFPVRDAAAARSNRTAGTSIRIWNLRAPIKRRIQEGTLLSTLKAAISRTYPLLLDRFVVVTLNGTLVRPDPLPIGGSDSVAPAMDQLDFSEPPVRVSILASVASTEGKEWNATNAGWYIICNGRVVVSADKTELTGWGTKLLPQFHSKYRAFIGIAFFFSPDPSALPWTTTKRGINRDSLVFQRAQPRMATVGRQVLAFLTRLYPSDLAEAPAEREVAASVERQDVRQLATRGPAEFKAEVKKRRGVADKIRIQFDATTRELERARRCLGQPSLSRVRVGREAFEYFLRNECGND